MDRRGRGGRLAAVLFTDLVRSTETASELGDRRWRELLARHHRIIRAELRRHRGHEQDTAGDGFFASFDAPADAIRCAVACVAAVREVGVEIRAGVNFGQIEIVDGKPGGIVVHAGARIMGQGDAGQVIVSSAAHDVVPGASIGFEDLGERSLKGLATPVHLYVVTSLDGEPLVGPASEGDARSRREGVAAPSSGSGRRWLSALAGVVALAIAAWVILDGRVDTPEAGPSGLASGSGSAKAVPSGSMAEIDPESGAVLQVVPLPLPSQFIDVEHTVTAGLGAVWIVRNERVVHLDPIHGDLQDPVPLPAQSISASYSVAIEAGTVWALSERSLFRVNPGSNEAKIVLPLYRSEVQTPTPAQLATSSGRIWIGTSTGALIRVNARSGSDQREETDGAIDALTVDADSVWALDRTAGAITRFDADTLRADAPIELTSNVSDLILDEDGKLWVLDAFGGTLTGIDPPRSIRVGDAPTALASGLGFLWVGDKDGFLRRIDSVTGESTRLTVGSPIAAIAVDTDRGSVWVETGSP